MKVALEDASLYVDQAKVKRPTIKESNLQTWFSAAYLTIGILGLRSKNFHISTPLSLMRDKKDLKSLSAKINFRRKLTRRSCPKNQKAKVRWE